MQARKVEAPLAPTAPVDEGAVETALGETIPQLREVLGAETAPASPPG
jgi:hypothetical protein